MAGRRPLPFDPIAEAARQWDAHGWSEATPGMAAVTSVFRAQQLFIARIDAVLRPMGLTFARYEMLRLLGFSRRGELPLGKIGDRLQVHPSSITNAADRLEESGLLERRRHPDDARTVLAVITPLGRDLCDRATEELNRRVFTDLGLDRESLRSLFRIIADLRRSAGDLAGTADDGGVASADEPAV